MKKKLVAFAVTAAMMITSAVPVFAADGWGIPEETEPVVNDNPNVINVEQGTPLPTYAIACDLSDSARTFSQIVDFNHDLGSGGLLDLDLVFKASKNGAAAETIKVRATKGADGYTLSTSGATITPDTEGDITVEGIVEFVWSVSKGKVELTVNELGDKYPKQVKYTATLAATTGYLDHMAATTNSANGAVMYYEYPEYVTDIVVQVKNPAYDSTKAGTEGYDVPEYIDADQPVYGETLYVNGITLTGDTKIAKTDQATYVTIRWYRDNEEIKDFAGKQTYKIGEDDRGHRITVKVAGREDTGVFGTVTWGAEYDALAALDRIQGANRYETAIAVAEQMRGTGTFDAFVIANGDKFADALSGTALAAHMDAPILLTNENNEQIVIDYINKNAAGYYNSTTVYLLGGEGAVSAELEKALGKYNVKRLGGDDRYATNLEILKEYQAQGGKVGRMFVASGSEYADALSVSPADYPVILVGDTLTSEQKAYLKGLTDITNNSANNSSIKYNVGAYKIIGGTAAVSQEIEDTLKDRAYIQSDARVQRIAGVNRYETNKAVVTNESIELNDYTKAYIVSGNNFCDALTAGVLAATSSDEAVIVLTNDYNTAIANELVKNKTAVVIGGTGAVSEEAVQKIVAKEAA